EEYDFHPRPLIEDGGSVLDGVFGRGLGDAGFVGEFFKKVPHAPKNSPTKGIATLGRKCEQRASFFYAFKGSFRAPLLQYRLGFLPLSLMDFFEASPYGVLANGGG
ncbi:MAG: hypothetical protein IIU88_00400, partial [Clostridia bacterium]|nr:hypothetical protein [Clostridia bacterium]